MTAADGQSASAAAGSASGCVVCRCTRQRVPEQASAQNCHYAAENRREKLPHGPLRQLPQREAGEATERGQRSSEGLLPPTAKNASDEHEKLRRRTTARISNGAHFLHRSPSSAAHQSAHIYRIFKI
ncbi:hypothetical protein HT118_07110 [Escherichia coli]|nr:hypothetical protein [Escherichia coli]